jgi:tripartite-type tricarboxylate transporter receptor subunit TctC
MKLPRRKFLHLAAGATALPAVSRITWAQPIRRDRCDSWSDSRQAAGRMSPGVSLQIGCRRSGAGSHLAIEIAAHANPDGYTMVLVGGAIPLYGLMIASIHYDPEADLTPVTLIGTYPNVLAVPNPSPWKSVGDLIAAAKVNPGSVTFSSPGVGTSPHLSGVLFGRMAGIDIRHVPYRGGAPALTDLIAGRVDCMFNTTGTLLAAVRAGQVRGLAVTSGKRFVTAPELPTIAESGVPDIDVTSWYALYMAANTPAPIVQKLSHDAAEIYRDAVEHEGHRDRLQETIAHHRAARTWLSLRAHSVSGGQQQRVALVRKGFAQAMRDPGLMAEAAKIDLELNFVSGEDVQSLVERLYHSPPNVLARAQAVAGTNY